MEVGTLVAIFAMAGDLFSSFSKRRLHLDSSSMAIGLDHVPEPLFPLLASRMLLPLSILDVVAGVTIFLVGAVMLSPLLANRISRQAALTCDPTVVRFRVNFGQRSEALECRRSARRRYPQASLKRQHSALACREKWVVAGQKCRTEQVHCVPRGRICDLA